MGRPYSPFAAEDARRFTPRDFSANTVRLKAEELGQKALAQSAISGRFTSAFCRCISSSPARGSPLLWPIVVPYC